MHPHYFTSSNYQSFLRQVSICSLSSTCITSEKSPNGRILWLLHTLIFGEETRLSSITSKDGAKQVLIKIISLTNIQLPFQILFKRVSHPKSLQNFRSNKYLFNLKKKLQTMVLNWYVNYSSFLIVATLELSQKRLRIRKKK